MKKFLVSTALAIVLSGGYAVSASYALDTYRAEPTDLRTSTFIGQRVYATEQMPSGQTVQAGAERKWEDIGKVNEVIISQDGSVKAVILGVGGFLGMGEKNVAVSLKDVKFVRSGDSRDYFLVVNANKQALTDMAAYEPVEKTAATDTTTTSSTNTDRTLLPRPEVTRQGYASAVPEELTADKLTGATVYGQNDETVGEINRLVMDDSGKINTVVIDVGGFLGIGEHHIGVTMDELNIVRDKNGSDVRVYINSNAEALKAQPEYKNPS